MGFLEYILTPRVLGRGLRGFGGSWRVLATRLLSRGPDLCSHGRRESRYLTSQPKHDRSGHPPCVLSLPPKHMLFPHEFVSPHHRSLKKHAPASFPTDEGADCLYCNPASRETGGNHGFYPGREHSSGERLFSPSLGERPVNAHETSYG